MLRHPYTLIVDQCRVSHPCAKRHLHLGHVPGVDQGLDEALWRGNRTRLRRINNCTAARVCIQTLLGKDVPLVFTGFVGNLASFPGEVASFGIECSIPLKRKERIGGQQFHLITCSTSAVILIVCFYFKFVCCNNNSCSIFGYLQKIIFCSPSSK